MHNFIFKKIGVIKSQMSQTVMKNFWMFVDLFALCTIQVKNHSSSNMFMDLFKPLIPVDNHLADKLRSSE